ncbi:MAG: 2-hydroxyacyl-CoA dehydratase subunit D, partial [Thermacetogeniaceae bacterium]
MDIYRTIQNLLKEKDRWGKVLSSPVSYRIVEGALLLARKSFAWQAIYQMSRFALSLTGRAYTGKAPVVWSSAFFPVEIAWGLGLCPFSPEVAAAFITALGFGGEELGRAEAAGYSRDLCSFHRCIAGAAAAGHLPRPAALLASTHLCDGAPLLFQNLAELYQVPCFVLDVPYAADSDAEEYVASQIERIWLGLAELTGRRADRGMLAEAIRRSNEFRENMIRANELRCRVPSPISGNDMLSFIYLFFIGQGSREAAEISALLAREIEKRIAAGAVSSAERFRILWLHLKPYYSN